MDLWYIKKYVNVIAYSGNKYMDISDGTVVDVLIILY